MYEVYGRSVAQVNLRKKESLVIRYREIDKWAV